MIPTLYRIICYLLCFGVVRLSCHIMDDCIHLHYGWRQIDEYDNEHERENERQHSHKYQLSQTDHPRSFINQTRKPMHAPRNMTIRAPFIHHISMKLFVGACMYALVCRSFMIGSIGALSTSHRKLIMNRKAMKNITIIKFASSFCTNRLITGPIHIPTSEVSLQTSFQRSLPHLA